MINANKHLCEGYESGIKDYHICEGIVDVLFHNGLQLICERGALSYIKVTRNGTLLKNDSVIYEWDTLEGDVLDRETMTKIDLDIYRKERDKSIKKGNTMKPDETMLSTRVLKMTMKNIGALKAIRKGELKKRVSIGTIVDESVNHYLNFKYLSEAEK